MNTAGSGWSESDIDLLRELRADGKSAAQICKEMQKSRPGITRSAILGKCLRLRLDVGVKKGAPSTPKPKRVAKPLPVARTRVVLPPMPALARVLLPEPSNGVEDAEIIRRGITLPALRGCKWCVQGPFNEEALSFFFCAEPRKPESPYCHGHSARAFREPQAFVRKPQVNQKRST